MCGTRKEMCNYKHEFCIGLQFACRPSFAICIFDNPSNSFNYFHLGKQEHCIQIWLFNGSHRKLVTPVEKSYCWTEFNAACELSMQLWIIRCNNHTYKNLRDFIAASFENDTRSTTCSLANRYSFLFSSHSFETSHQMKTQQQSENCNNNEY